MAVGKASGHFVHNWLCILQNGITKQGNENDRDKCIVRNGGRSMYLSNVMELLAKR